jgi:hypothetical protein
LVVVINDDEELIGKAPLHAQGCDCIQKRVPATLGIGADDNRHSARGSGRESTQRGLDAVESRRDNIPREAPSDLADLLYLAIGMPHAAIRHMMRMSHLRDTSPGATQPPIPLMTRVRAKAKCPITPRSVQNAPLESARIRPFSRSLDARIPFYPMRACGCRTMEILPTSPRLAPVGCGTDVTRTTRRRRTR